MDVPIVIGDEAPAETTGGGTEVRVSICGVPVDGYPDARTAIDAIDGRSSADSSDCPIQVNFINAHVVNLASSDPALRRILNDSGINLADGIGIWLGGRILSGIDLRNLNGTDFGLELLRWGAGKGLRFFFLGARDGIAEVARRKLVARIPGLAVVGTHDGYLDESSSRDVVRRVVEARTDILFVCMGVPAQELWIDAHRHELDGVKAALGLGAFFDFYAEAVKRAPSWMIAARIEWIYRLLNEPRRLWKRYLLGNFSFMARVLASWASERAGRRRPGAAHRG